MTTHSGKNKGRKLQQRIRDELLRIGAAFGLLPGDVRSCSMGASGLDILLSPAAIKVFGPLAIEAKNRETLNVVTTFWDHATKYKESIPLLVHKKNHTDPLVTLRLDTFSQLLERGLNVTTQTS